MRAFVEFAIAYAARQITTMYTKIMRSTAEFDLQIQKESRFWLKKKKIDFIKRGNTSRFSQTYKFV